MNENAKRILAPVYAFAFIEALIFWYAIEKILWSNSGITAEQVIILGIIAQSGQVLIEVPSSIIADRWSRRKTLIVASVFMLVAISIVLAVRSFFSFAAMSLVWAFYFSFQSGTINAYVYDLLKEHNEQAQYRKAISRYGTYQLSGLLVSSLGSSLLIKSGNILLPYWVTLIPTITAIILLTRMHEPKIARTAQSLGSVFDHVHSAVRNIAIKKWLSYVFIGLAFVTAGRFIWYEYYQLYALKQAIPSTQFGIMLALIHIGNLLGSEFAHRIKNPNTVILASFGLLSVSTLVLALTIPSWAIIPLLVICFFGSQACSIVLDENLQHETDSELRATTLSLSGLLSRIIFGCAALAIIAYQVTPKAIAILGLIAFMGTLFYFPVRKRLVSA